MSSREQGQSRDGRWPNRYWTVEEPQDLTWELCPTGNVVKEWEVRDDPMDAHKGVTPVAL